MYEIGFEYKSAPSRAALTPAGALYFTLSAGFSHLQHRDVLQKKADSQYSDRNDKITVLHGEHAGGNVPWRTV